MNATAPITQDVLTLPRVEGAPQDRNLIGLTRDHLKSALLSIGTPERQVKMRVNQVWAWLYQKGARDFSLMTNLSKEFRTKLAENFEIKLPEVVTRQVSQDGTRKYLMRIAGGHEIETVYIPEEGRGKKVLTEDHLLPDRSGDHDGVKQCRFEQD